jgi:hypothetical protein
MYDALKYTVGLRLDELRSQQQRAITVAAADGVLIGFVSATTAAATGLSRALVLTALVLLVFGLLAAAVAMWPRHLPGLGSGNPALVGLDDAITAEMCTKLSATLSGPQLKSVYKTRGHAITAQMGLVGVALALLVLAAFAPSPAPTPGSTVRAPAHQVAPHDRHQGGTSAWSETRSRNVTCS